MRVGSAPGVDIVYTDAGRSHRVTVRIEVTVRFGATTCWAD
ncbi:hypothetical protein [Jiangella rhizosphaerae]|nr:hypothetical protein [Jiangella rhizosphaerae]